eukprot:scaffold29327_cov101-Isochrysis_galbana.AAC.3
MARGACRGGKGLVSVGSVSSQDWCVSRLFPPSVGGGMRDGWTRTGWPIPFRRGRRATRA